MLRIVCVIWDPSERKKSDIAMVLECNFMGWLVCYVSGFDRYPSCWLSNEVFHMGFRCDTSRHVVFRASFLPLRRWGQLLVLISTSIRKKLGILILVGTAIKSTETSSWDETWIDYMHFNPFFSWVYSTAKLKMHALSSCFFSATCFSAFYYSPY